MDQEQEKQPQPWNDEADNITANPQHEKEIVENPNGLGGDDQSQVNDQDRQQQLQQPTPHQQQLQQPQQQPPQHHYPSQGNQNMVGAGSAPPPAVRQDVLPVTNHVMLFGGKPVCTATEIVATAQTYQTAEGLTVPVYPPVAAPSPSEENAAALDYYNQGPLRKRRMCKFPGCTRVIKSQGNCQAHGAKAKRCSVEGCDKQAQTTHDGMCKRHWRLKNYPAAEEQDDEVNPPPVAAAAVAVAHQQPYEELLPLQSVYETILPQSIAFRPMAAAKSSQLQQNGKTRDPLDPPPAPEGAVVMPLVAYLQEGACKPFGWHRNEERMARGLKPTANLSSQLESWERQLAVVEILLLGGGTPYASFQNLAHGWGRKKGFHSALINDVCERRGDIIRKRKNEFGVGDTAQAKRASVTAASAIAGAASQQLQQAKGSPPSDSI